MKILARCILPLAASLLLRGGIGAPPASPAEELASSLPEEVEEYADRDMNGLLRGLEEFLRKAPDVFFRELKGTVVRGALILAVAGVSGLAAPLAKGPAERMVDLAGTAAVSVLALEGSGSVLMTAVDTVHELSDWSALTLPVMAVSSAASGNVNGAAAFYAASALGMGLLSRMVLRVVLPAVCAFTALSVAAGGFHAPSLRKTAAVMKQLAKWALTLLAGTLFAYLVLSGFTASGADAVALKSAKTALGAIPVVGGITSEAASAVLAGTAMIRGTAGLLGILGTLGICLGPFLRLLAVISAFRIAAALTASFSQGSIPPLLEDLCSGFSFLLSACGLSALYLFFSIVLMMRGTGL